MREPISVSECHNQTRGRHSRIPQEYALPEHLQDQTDAQRRSRREADIERFTERQLPGPNQDLFKDMLITLCRLARDGAGRGELKLLSKALAELRYALRVFGPYREIRKISIFGSSRTPEDDPNYQAAVEFARQISDSNWMIMKAGHHGAGRAASFGVAIRLPFEQKTNTVIAADDKLVNFRYFFTRKLVFIKEASAIALFPGGFGTLDEGFEALTLIQTGKAPVIPVVLLERPGGTYWQRWRAYVEAELLRAGMVSPEDMDLFTMTDDMGLAVRVIRDFYRVYHSMRYVSLDLVMRLEHPLQPGTLERLNDEFGDILARGQFEQTGILPAEDGELAEKPRLKFAFNRKNFGRLRRLIDVINSDPGPRAEGR
jgi:predicted Rossmann-fold nucleotide-binding protein